MTAPPPDAPSSPDAGHDTTQKRSFADWVAFVHSLVSDLITPRNIVLLVVLGALGIITLVGGWSTVSADDRHLEQVEAGKPVTVAPFELTVRKAFAADELEGLLPKKPGFRYLMVTLDVTADADQPVHAVILADSVVINAAHLSSPQSLNGTFGPRPQINRLLDSLSPRQFQPDVTTPIVLVWQQDAAAPRPEKIQVALMTRTFGVQREGFTEDWINPEPTHRLELPVGAPK